MSDDLLFEARAAEVAEVRRPLATVSVRTIAWVALGLAFLLLRLGPIWQAPVGGAELIHLSGAWQAREGIDDARYVPTLFQAISAFLLRISSSESLPRILAFVASGTIPIAVYFLRRVLGEAGALFTLLCLTLDAPSISMASSASALGFDLPLTLWLAVAIARPDTPRWAWPALSAGVVLSGPLALPLVAAAVGLALYQRKTLDRDVLTWSAVAALLAVLMATLRFGVGVDGLRLPPVTLFDASFNEAWSTATGYRLGLLYGAPLLLGGTAALGYAAWSAWQARSANFTAQVLLAWPAVSLAWFLASGSSHSPLALISLTTSLALLTGPALSTAMAAMFRADWYWPRLVFPAAAIAAGIALGKMLDWARVNAYPKDSEDLQVVGLLIIVAGALAVFAFRRTTRATLLVPVLVLAGLSLVANAFGVGLSYIEEPMPSPYSPSQARELRDVALDLSASRGGPIIVHESLKDDLTWPMRDSGAYIVGTRVLPTAAVVIWPLSEPPPEGFAVVEGDWAISRAIQPPLGFLKIVRWLSDRNSLAIRPKVVAVYTRKDEP